MAVKKLKTKISRLETIADSLESDDQEIEAAIKIYEEAMKLVKECNTDLDKLEGRVLMMKNDQEIDFEGTIDEL